MTKGPASESALGDLHSKVAKVMSNALENIETAQTVWSENDIEGAPPEVNPALLSVMVRFLDANKITCAPEQGNTMSELEQKLAAKRQRRRVGNVVAFKEEDE